MVQADSAQLRFENPPAEKQQQGRGASQADVRHVSSTNCERKSTSEHEEARTACVDKQMREEGFKQPESAH